jgi:ParB family chromosome partitioning protein
MKKKALGRGLSALFDEGNPLEELDKIQEESAMAAAQLLRISEIEPNKDQPRKHFDPEALLQLAESIGQHGVLQPILVSPLPEGGYQIVAGERRWRAARMAGLTEIPAVVKSLPEEVVLQLALIENLQREDLNPMEEAKGYYRLCEEYHLTQEQVAKVVGKSRPAIGNALRLLKLDDSVAQMVEDGQLSAGHARTLLGFPVEEQKKIAALAVEKKLSVRELEDMALRYQKQQEKDPLENGKKLLHRDGFYDDVQLRLEQSFGKKATIKVSQDKGKIELRFGSKEELKELLTHLSLSETL